MVGGAPLVIKLLEGTQGIGVVLAETRTAAESVIEAFMGLNANILVQEYIREAKGADIRCFVVGNKVVAAMKRQAKEGEFRSNLAVGGYAEKTELTPQEREICAALGPELKRLGLIFVGIDVIGGRYLTEINVTSPTGIVAIDRFNGSDTPARIWDAIERRLAERAAVQ